MKIVIYKYGLNLNYEDYASGRVLYHGSGVPNFPVRLINEIYGRCVAYLGKEEDISVYDCCLGGGYSLTVLGFLNQGTISKIYGSDIDESMLAIARRNLSLLSCNGIEERIGELEGLYELHGKESHNLAIESAKRLKKELNGNIEINVFQGDVFKPIDIDTIPDIIITDVPYGGLVDWQGGDNVGKMIESLCNISDGHTIIAVIMDKKQKFSNDRLIRLEKNIVGKRKFEIYRLKA
ncbi:MAG: hypothetical protein K0S61_3271 [Anaerocolumna sp.]|nr:hypothetical protein [Anaerocolumna sp.]